MFPNNNNPFFFQGFGSNNGQWQNNAMNPNAGAYAPNPAGQWQNQQPWGPFNSQNGPLGQQGMAWTGQMGTAMGQPMMQNNGMSMLPTQLPQGDPHMLQLQQERLSLQGQVHHLQTQEQLSSMQEQVNRIHQSVQDMRGPANNRGRGHNRRRGSRNPRNAERGNLNSNNNSGQENVNNARKNPGNNRRGRSVLAAQNPGRVGRPGVNSDGQQQLQRLQERVRVFEQQHGGMRDNTVLAPQANATAINNVTMEHLAEGARVAYGAGFTQGHQAGVQHGVNAAVHTTTGLMTQALAGPIQNLVEETVRRELNNRRRVTELPDEEGNNHQPAVGADP